VRTLVRLVAGRTAADPERPDLVGPAAAEHARGDDLGINPIVTLEQQLPNMIGNLVYSG
jgi:hypothetical protein